MENVSKKTGAQSCLVERTNVGSGAKYSRILNLNTEEDSSLATFLENDVVGALQRDGLLVNFTLIPSSGGGSW